MSITPPAPDPALPRLAVGVMGAGVFGRYHAGKVAGSPRARLAGVFDPDRARAEALAAQHGCGAFDDADALIAACEAVTIAAPAAAHANLAQAALEADRSVYVEKPLATTLADGRSLVALAEARNRVLQVGHQERFVFEAMGLLAPGRAAIRTLESWREGTPSDRGLDVSVTLDLMIHDLDLVRRLIRAPLVRLDAQALEGDPNRPDAVEAFLHFEDGAEVTRTASRVASERRRGMRLTTEQGEAGIDFLARTIEGAAAGGLVADVSAIVPDSLGLAIESFFAAVRGEAPCPVPGVQALEALDLALAIDAACARD
jgi:predicted dehydrogenase